MNKYEILQSAGSFLFVVAFWGWTMFLVERGKHNELKRKIMESNKAREARRQQ